MNVLAPSILAADFSILGEQVKKADEAGAQYIHIDVMDGVCVPSISFGFPIIETLRPVTDKLFDVHLMIIQPERYIERFKEAGADQITFHVEACDCIDETLEKIHTLGARAGLALHPETPVTDVFPYLEKVEQITIMTVRTGFGGQSYREECTQKIIDLRKEITERGLDVSIEVDGGVTKDNAAKIIAAGANVLVSGSTVFRGDITQNVKELLEILGQ
ncbi:MAG: ribulose-phosphate 3-epimerase [Lachnospiraceae bacterium]|jgi:ribulose-phosphate 3-epimerase|nr:ribulose-phosphate 3-epimerase [Lachnospiraceae bacterium]